MAETIVGIVKKINSKKTAKGLFYSILVEDDQGEEWLGWGKYPPKFGEGSEIEVDFTANGDFLNADVKSLDIIDLVEPEEEEKSSGRGRGRGGRGEKNTRGGSRSGRSGGGRRSSRDYSDGDAGEDKPSRRSKSSKSGGGSSSGGKSGGLSAEEWAAKDRTIQYKAARKDAVAIVSAAVAAGALPLGPKKAEQFDTMMAKVEELTEEFFFDTMRKPADLYEHGPSEGDDSEGE